MQSTVLIFARKPLPQPAFRRMRQMRRGRLARLRDDIFIMRAIKRDYVTIAKRSGISPEDTRDLSPKTYKSSAVPRLTRHAIKALLTGRHAHVGGKAIPKRAKNLIKIAAAYTYEQLLEESGIGTATATEIQLWLQERGASLKLSD